MCTGDGEGGSYGGGDRGRARGVVVVISST